MRLHDRKTWLSIAAALTLITGVNVTQAQIPEQPLVNLGRVPIDLGYPRLNLGYPTQNIIDPEVGKVVRLAQGFGGTPDFTYSFTHPLAQYENPLVNRGPYGTYNSPFEPGNGPNNRLRLTPPAATPPRPAVSDTPITPPATTVNFLPVPWHVAAQKAKYVPEFGLYAHHASDSLIKGAYVTGIGVDGVGHKAGLLPGDVITSIDGKPLTSSDAYQDAIDHLKTPWSLEVWNSHTNRTATITSPNDLATP